MRVTGVQLASLVLPLITGMAFAERLETRQSQRVLIPVVVTDYRDRYVSGLTKNQFKVLENGVEQDITDFDATDRGPISVTFVMDLNGDIGNERTEQVATQLLRTAKTGDEFSVVDFKGGRTVFSGFKDSVDELEKVVTAPHEERTRPILEGVRLAIDESRQAKNSHKFIVIVSDGSPETFPHTRIEVEALAAASDASIYSVSRNYIDVSASASEAQARAMVDLLVKRTGGRHFTIEPAPESRDLAMRIAADLRTSYLVGFRSSASSSAGSYRQIEIRVVTPQLQFLDTRHRPGYTAPQ